MEDTIGLQDRLDRIEQICEAYLDTSGFPKEVIMKHIIELAKGDASQKEE
jgi:hypothetical protein